MIIRPLKSHDFALRLTVSRTISRSHDQLRNSHGKWIHKLIYKLFLNYWPSPLFFEGLDTTIHTWKTNAKYVYPARAITILVKMADRNVERSDSDADFSEPEFSVC